jgi:hypothetical protein
VETRDLIELGDIDELIRYVDRICKVGDWEELLHLRDMCRAALERGKQLWAVSSHAEYRLALEASGEFTAKVLVPGTGQFALGPLAEVAASSHLYGEVEKYLTPSPIASYFAHECVIRGEDLRDAPITENVLEIPFFIQTWEPFYPSAIYNANDADFPAPQVPDVDEIKLPPSSRYKVLKSSETENALRELVSAWTQESNGRCTISFVEGGPLEAIAALGVRKVSIAPLTLDEALSHFAWAAANGGAHGSRRGMAMGRFSAWWVLAACCNLSTRWPVSAADLHNRAEELKFWFFTTSEPETGWNLKVAIHNPKVGRAWAISAHDTFSL